MKVLIVDDEEMIRAVLREYVEFEGGEADEAQDGMEAVKMCRENDYDVVLMDLQMPVMDGWQASMAIRALDDKEKAEIPIIALTANVLENDRRRARESGIDAHLRKPMDLALLLRTMEELTGKKRPD